MMMDAQSMIAPDNITSRILVRSKVICIFGIGQIWSWLNIKSAYWHEQGSIKQCCQSYENTVGYKSEMFHFVAFFLLHTFYPYNQLIITKFW